MMIYRNHTLFFSFTATYICSSSIHSKMRIEDDVFLSDHTVAKDDPRILETLKSIDRIRSRTGFDPLLMKNKVWAKKVCKDLGQGLAQVDGISVEKRRCELLFMRNIESEKYLMTRRLDQMSKNLFRTGQEKNNLEEVGHSRFRLMSAYGDLRKSVNNLKVYTEDLETQGGFFKNVEQVCPDERIAEPRTTLGKATSLPQLVNVEVNLSKEPKIFCVYRHLITQSSGPGRFYRIRSPSLPTIQVRSNAFKNRIASFPDDLTLYMKENN